MAFPVSPTNGQQYTVNGVTYVYDSTMGVWDPQGAAASASPVSSVAGRTGAVTLTAADIGAGTFPGALTAASSLTVGGAVTAGSFSGPGTGLTGTASGLTAGSATTATTATNQSGGTVSATSVTSSGAVTSGGNSGFNNATYSSGLRNPIWYFGNASTYGISYFQGTAGIGGNDTIGIHPNGQASAGGSTLGVATTGVYSIVPLSVTGAITATASVTAYYSDERLKTRVGKIENALDKVDELTGFLYVENDLAKSFGFNNPDVQVALSAQAVKRVQPEATALAPFDRDLDGNSKSGENYLTVQYERLVPLLVEAIKELRQEVNSIKQQIK
jgi:hypothetical protein